MKLFLTCLLIIAASTPQSRFPHWQTTDWAEKARGGDEAKEWNDWARETTVGSWH